MKLMERRAERAKRQERDLEKFISLQGRRALGRKAVEAAQLRFAAAEQKLDEYLPKERWKIVDFGGQLVEVSTIDLSPLREMRYFYAAPHGWTPSHWSIAGERKISGPVRLYADKAGGRVSGTEHELPYITGETEEGETVTIFLGPNTVIERIEELSSDE